MGYSLQVFVSSACYELRDLRAAIKDWLIKYGIVPMLSDQGGFPHTDGIPPYASCLPVLEECPLVIVVINRQYGQTFDDWGPYTQYTGLSPTHAEIRHALDQSKRVLFYVHEDTLSFYEVWRKNKDAFKTSAPNGLDETTLIMLKELKTRKPAPWIERYCDVTDIIRSLSSEFVNQLSQLYLHLNDIGKARYSRHKIKVVKRAVKQHIDLWVNEIIAKSEINTKIKKTNIESKSEKNKLNRYRVATRAILNKMHDLEFPKKSEKLFLRDDEISLCLMHLANSFVIKSSDILINKRYADYKKKLVKYSEIINQAANNKICYLENDKNNNLSSLLLCHKKLFRVLKDSQFEIIIDEWNNFCLLAIALWGSQEKNLRLFRYLDRVYYI